MKLLTVIFMCGWMFVSVLIAMNAISEAIFANRKTKLWMRLVCAVMWPVAMLSASGRSYLTKQVKG